MSEKTPPEKPFVVSKRGNAYVGCEAPVPFALRWQAYCEASGKGKRIALCEAMESAVIKYEGKIDNRMGAVYDALLEFKAKKAGLSVNLLKLPLTLVKQGRGRPKK